MSKVNSFAAAHNGLEELLIEGGRSVDLAGGRMQGWNGGGGGWMGRVERRPMRWRCLYELYAI